MKHIIKILLLLLPVFANAQYDPNWGYITAKQVDSLRQSVGSEKNDTLLMSAYRSLGFYYQDGKRDSSVYFHKLQLEQSKKLNIKMWQADAYSQLGYMYQALGDVTKAYEAILEAKSLTEDKKDESANWHPWVFSNAQNLHEARTAILAINTHALANFYGSVNEIAKQRAAYFETIRLGETINNGKIIALGYRNLAHSYQNDSSILFVNKSMQYAKAAGYKKYNGMDMLEIARIFFIKGNMDSVKKYAYASVAPELEQNNLIGLLYSYYTLSIVYKAENQKDSSLYYAKKSVEMSDLTQPGLEVDPLTNLADIYSLMHNVDSAYKYQKLASLVNDSLSKAKIGQLTNYQKFAFNEQLRLKKINDDEIAHQNKIKLYAAIAVLAALTFVAIILYKNNRQKQQTNKILQTTLTDLKSTQSQLIQSEKMASLGELTAGIAHEIQNPLNFVNNFSEVSNELIDEMNIELDKGDIGEAKVIASDIKQNLEKINHHGKRADAIVKGMLQHSQSSKGQKEPTDINALCDEYLRLSYHGLRAKDKFFNATLKTDFDNSIGKVNIIPQDIGRVIMNLLTNAFYAVNEKKQPGPGSYRDAEYEPTVSIITRKEADKVLITVSDNGNGIPQNIVDKIFQPFFTTKPTGQGTGLGLSLSYDIVTKGHGGALKVKTDEGEGSTFIIQLPIAENQ